MNGAQSTTSGILVRRLWLEDFRNHAASSLTFPAGLTVISGGNGEGKSSILEAIAYLANLSSFRGVPNETLIRVGSDSSVVRAELDVDGREQLIEAQIVRSGRNRIQVNRRPLKRARDLLGTLRVVVFSPDDLELIKGSPGQRRRFLDEVLSALSVTFRGTRGDFDRVLKQRNTVLRQARGRASAEIDATLDVWDAKFSELGQALATQRQSLAERLVPLVAGLYHRLASSDLDVTMHYRSEWTDVGLAEALRQSRADELRRRVTLIGPHRDDLEIRIGGLRSRTHSSQGEQRTLAIALRLATQRIVASETQCEPVVLLDDVFSELDQHRTAALMAELPATQTVLTTATATVPVGQTPAATYVVRGGIVESRNVNASI